MTYEKCKRRTVKIIQQLLKLGYNEAQITEFWDECFAEVEIQQKLPPCTCKDANQCETWCRTKARFVLYPPED